MRFCVQHHNKEGLFLVQKDLSSFSIIVVIKLHLFVK